MPPFKPGSLIQSVVAQSNRAHEPVRAHKLLRYLKRFVSAVLLVLLTIVFDTCQEDNVESLTAEQEAVRKLSLTWRFAEVLYAPAPKDRSLDDLTLTFGVTASLQPARFSASGAPGFFRTSHNSTWSWECVGPARRVVLSHVTPVRGFAIDALTETDLIIRVSGNVPAGGRRGGRDEYCVRLTRR